MNEKVTVLTLANFWFVQIHIHKYCIEIYFSHLKQYFPVYNKKNLSQVRKWSINTPATTELLDLISFPITVCCYNQILMCVKLFSIFFLDYCIKSRDQTIVIWGQQCKIQDLSKPNSHNDVDLNFCLFNSNCFFFHHLCWALFYILCCLASNLDCGLWAGVTSLWPCRPLTLLSQLDGFIWHLLAL